MDFLGVGPLELIFVLLIIFLVLNPKDLAATGRKIGRGLSTIRKSEFWRGVTQVTREVRDLPTTLMREAELEDAKKELEQDLDNVRGIAKEFKQDHMEELKKEIESSMKVEEDNTIAPPTDAAPDLANSDDDAAAAKDEI
jgi:Sec-independent protein translocase protein TatA